MTPARWGRIKEIFGAARERPESQRPEYLDGVCNGDAELRAEVEGLLAEDDPSSLASPAADLLGAREYRPGDFEAAFPAIACPPDRARNAEIWAEAGARGIPVIAVDDPPHCSFIFPAIHRQGDLVIAVSSGGKSPALASRVRDRIALEFGPAYARFLDLLGQLRPEVTERFPGFERRREIWYRLVDSRAIDYLNAGEPEAALAELRSVLEKA